MRYVIHRNGSFDLCAEGIGIRSCYPAVDGVPVRPVTVRTEENQIVYRLEQGEMCLSFLQDDKGIAIGMTVKGIDAHDIEYFARGIANGCTQGFRQGLGRGGPSGFFSLEDGAPFASDAVFALGDKNKVLSFHFTDHTTYRNGFLCEQKAVSAVVYTENVLGGGRGLPSLFIREAENFDAALRGCAEEIARTMRARKMTSPAFHWCSWYYLYQTLDQPTLEEYLRGFSALKERAPFSHIQIDAGYFPSVGDWLKKSARFPNGMQAAAEVIRESGYEPGIWVAPFMAGNESDLVKQHPDWLLRNLDGTPLCLWKSYGEPKIWGFRDCEYYVVDYSHPDAMAYIRNVFHTLRSWGYTLFKTDFLLWGLQDSTTVLRHAPGKTSFEYFREVMTAIREEIGDALWLGCIAPFMPCVGFVDMMRVGYDVGAQWNEDDFGPENMIRELTADQYFNNVYWQNDPDVVMLRDFQIHMDEPQIRALALLAATSGGVITTSDPIHSISSERLELLELIRPHSLVKPVYPQWQKDDGTICIVNQCEHGYSVLWFNSTDAEKKVAADWTWCDGMHYVREYKGTSQRIEDVRTLLLPPRSGRLFFVTEQEIEEPCNLWIW